MIPFPKYVLSVLFLTITHSSICMNNFSNTYNMNLPDSFLNRKATEKQHIDTKDVLYNYIDGGAEQFISYGFRNAVSVTYSRNDGPDIRVEIFDMGSSKNAYGIFSNIRYDENNKFGQGSQYVTGALFFWKNKYYVSITTIEETSETVNFIKEMAEYICQQIPVDGEKPQILKLLPQQNLDPNGILYFHNYIWLNSFMFISNDNILNIEDKTDAVFAKYGNMDNRSFLLIVHYQDSTQLAYAYDKFIQQYFSEPIANELFMVDNNRWMGLKTEASDLIILFNGETKQQTEDLIRQTIENIRKFPISDENSLNK